MPPVLRRAGIVALIATSLFGAIFLDILMCPMATVIHVPCPGCGMTRATLAAIHGNFRESFHFHPLALILTPLFALYLGSHAVSYVIHGVSRIDQVVKAKWIDFVMLALLISMLAVWIARFFGFLGGPVPV